MQLITLDFLPEELSTLAGKYPNISSQVQKALGLLSQPSSEYAIIYLENKERRGYIPMQLIQRGNRLTVTQVPLVHGVGMYQTGDQLTDLEGLVQKGLISDNFPNAMIIPPTDSSDSYEYTTGSKLQESFGDRYWLEIWHLEVPDDDAQLNPQKREIFHQCTQPRVKKGDGAGIFASVYTAQPNNFSIVVQINPNLPQDERIKRQTFYKEKFGAEKVRFI